MFSQGGIGCELCVGFSILISLLQTADDLPAIQQKALKLGAKDAVVVDAREEVIQMQRGNRDRSNALH